MNHFLHKHQYQDYQIMKKTYFIHLNYLEYLEKYLIYNIFF